MGSYNRQHTDGKIGDRKHQDSLRGRNYQYEPCNANYFIGGAASYAFPTGATGTNGRICFPGGDVLMHYKGAGQTLFGPLVDSTNGRLSVALDQTNTEGVEYVFDSFLAGTASFGRHFHKTGTSRAAFGRLKTVLEDVSGLSEMAFGLREAEAFTANFDDYTDLAAINVQNGVVNLETILNNAATVTTNTGQTWADGAEKVISYTIGLPPNPLVAKFYIDGRQVGSYTFPTGLVLVPFAFLLQGVDLSLAHWTFFEIGNVKDVERGI